MTCCICDGDADTDALCSLHGMLLQALAYAIDNGKVSDWEQPKNKPLIMTHKHMLTDANSVSPDWRTQMLVTLSFKGALWDDGMDDIDSLGDWIADSIEQYGFPGFEVCDDDD